MQNSTGSPPHTWRIHFRTIRFAAFSRITSTYVENTLRKAASYEVAKDHLHIRGEYDILSKIFHLKLGSPPHTWRIHDPIIAANPFLGITSTYVENTFTIKQRKFHFADHLHIRGEYHLSLCKRISRQGSPPHTWRIPAEYWLDENLTRITSTYVENTRWCRSINRKCEDHLHIRGEY